jgi:hypothetical protein
MFEPGMVCARVNEIGETELAYIPQALERGRIEEGEGILLDFHVAVDRVLDDLHRY